MTTTKEYCFAGDSDTVRINAKNRQDAARKYTTSDRGLDALLAAVKRAGGWITISEDGVVIARVTEAGDIRRS